MSASPSGRLAAAWSAGSNAVGKRIAPLARTLVETVTIAASASIVPRGVFTRSRVPLVSIAVTGVESATGNPRVWAATSAP